MYNKPSISAAYRIAGFKIAMKGRWKVPARELERRFVNFFLKIGPACVPFFILTGCFGGREGSPALKVFSALGICLAAIFLIFYIVIKGREKE